MRLNKFTLTLMVLGIIYFLLDRSGYLDHWITPKNQTNKVKDEITKDNYFANQENFVKNTTGLLF